VSARSHLVFMSMGATNPAAPPRGRGFESNWTIAPTDEASFDADWTTLPNSLSFDADFTTDTYLMETAAFVYGLFQTTDGAEQIGEHNTGTTQDILRSGFDSDFCLWADPQEPIGFEGISFSSDFTVPRHVAETYPSPISFDANFEDGGYSFDANFAGDAYKMATAGTVFGTFNTNPDRVFLTGRLVRPPLPFTVNQILPGSSLDDRMGYFILGTTTLGGNPL
jgi:hypothetical protein